MPFEPTPLGEEGGEDTESQKARHARTVAKFRDMLRDGKLEERSVELSVEQRNSPVQVYSPTWGRNKCDMDLQGMLERMMPQAEQRAKTHGC